MRVNIPLTFLLGTAAGYVAGSAAGRRRYEQIRTAAGNFVHDPAVRDTASKVATSAASAGTATATKAKDVASTVKDAVQKNGDNGGNDIQLDPSLRIDADAPTIS
jgi:hypothetical protein